MLRAAGILAVVLSCAALGYGQSFRLYRRCQSLEELERILTMLKGEIAYAAAPLEEAFREIAGRCSSSFRAFLFGCAAEIEKKNGTALRAILEEQGKAHLSGNGLHRGDMQRIASLGERLGYLDIQMQERTIQMCLEELRRERGEAQEDYRKKARVYRSLGLSAGIFITLLLL